MRRDCKQEELNHQHQNADATTKVSRAHYIHTHHT
jgi:hypothetical protein